MLISPGLRHGCFPGFLSLTLQKSAKVLSDRKLRASKLLLLASLLVPFLAFVGSGHTDEANTLRVGKLSLNCLFAGRNNN